MKKYFAVTLAALGFLATPALAETTACTEITSIPTTISAQGIYCLKGNLVTAITSGNAITVEANNVTIDLNRWKLGGAAAGLATNAAGIFAVDRRNITIRNGTIRGFRFGITINGDVADSSGHIIENITADLNRQQGIQVNGSNTKIINNIASRTGPGDSSDFAMGISVNSGEGVLVYGNTVSGVTETNAVYGINLSGLINATVSHNNVFSLKSAISKYGIVNTVSERVALVENTVATNNGGTTGIGDFSSSTEIACIRNNVSGFTSNLNGCDTDSGNIPF